MGRTLPSATQNLHSQEGSLSRFRRALRRRDQLVLDDLFDAAYKHIAAVAYAANLMPFESYLLCMLLEEHKAVMRLQNEVAELKDRHD
ncbi:MAG: hypothetical protein SVR81_02675 [Chloroflexota bacterium]|nr:hypothetical protein [Chloroflexota bacterium]